MLKSDPGNEFARWRFSTLVVLPFMLAPGLAWQAHELTELYQSTGSPAQSNADEAIFSSIGHLGAGIIPVALYLIAILLWHWPLMAFENRSSLYRRNREYLGFVVVLFALLLPLVWKEVAASKCLLTYGVTIPVPTPPGTYYEYWDWLGPCEATHGNVPYADYLPELTLVLYAVLAIRAAKLWIDHRRLRHGME